MSIEERVAQAWPWLIPIAIVASLISRSVWPVVALVLLPLVLRGWRMRHGRQLRIYREIGPLVVGEAFLAALIVATVALLILSLGSPILSWGWFSEVARATGDRSGGATNIVVVPLEIPLLALPFLALLVWTLPDLAAVEERIFRLGTRDWLDGLRRSLTFAIAHLIMGIPIGAIVPLTLAGLWLTRHYFRGGIARSTRYHLAYNLCLVIVATLAFVVLPLLIGEDVG
ncbi:MAG TPA: hypothetical protein VGL23_03050 [Chloroflexota bacterium]